MLRQCMAMCAIGLLSIVASCAAPRPGHRVADAPGVDASLHTLTKDTAGQAAPGALPTPEEYATMVSSDINAILAAQSGEATATAPNATAPALAAVHAAANGLDSSPTASWPWSGVVPDRQTWAHVQQRLGAWRANVLEPAWAHMRAQWQLQSRTPAERLASLGGQIADVLRARSDEPGVLTTLAALECIRPGVLYEIADPATLALMAPGERAALDAIMRVVFPGEASKPTRAHRFLNEAAGVWDAMPTTISAAVLARRVWGFGQYEPFDTLRFVAGQPQRMIVYTEIDHFAQRPVTSADDAPPGAQWAIELSQELRLFRDAVYVWGSPEERIVETSRNTRRDFYLVHEIELPPTLAVGPYELKIILRDKTTGDVDERIIPLEYVASPAAASAR